MGRGLKNSIWLPWYIQKIKSYTTREENSMSDELDISLRDRLSDMGINTLLIDELVCATGRVNYGQVRF